MMKVFQGEGGEDPGSVDLTRDVKCQLGPCSSLISMAVNRPHCYVPCCFPIPNMVVNDSKALTKESR